MSKDYKIPVSQLSYDEIKALSINGKICLSELLKDEYTVQQALDLLDNKIEVCARGIREKRALIDRYRDAQNVVKTCVDYKRVIEKALDKHLKNNEKLKKEEGQ